MAKPKPSSPPPLLLIPYSSVHGDHIPVLIPQFSFVVSSTPPHSSYSRRDIKAGEEVTDFYGQHFFQVPPSTTIFLSSFLHLTLPLPIPLNLSLPLLHICLLTPHSSPVPPSTFPLFLFIPQLFLSLLFLLTFPFLSNSPSTFLPYLFLATYSTSLLLPTSSSQRGAPKIKLAIF